MRRPLAAALVLVPLAVALLYAGAHAFLAPRPTLDDVVPREAVLTLRFRGVEALDEHWPFEIRATGRASEVLAEEKDLPGLAGVDRARPIHVVYLPRAARADPSLTILPVADARALRDRFEGRDRAADDPRALDRYAQHLEIRGDWAALAWDREAVRHLGEGGITCADRGEDFAIAIDVPRAAEFAMGDAARPPWRALLEALGAEPSRFVARIDPATGRRAYDFPAGRVGLVAQAWRTARFWAWKQRREVEIELEPADERLRGLLLALAKSGPALESQPLARAPLGALAWAHVYGGEARAVLGRTLHLLGVPSADGLFGSEAARRAVGTLRAWAVANTTDGHSWTLVVESLGAEVPDLSPALPALPPVGGSLPLAPGAAPLIVSDTRWSGRSPGGTILRASMGRPADAGGFPDTHERLVIGADAERVAAQLAAGTEWQPGHVVGLTGDWRSVGTFGIAPQRVHDVLGKLPAPGGLLSVLAGGGLDGDLATDGRVLRLRLRVAAR